MTEDTRGGESRPASAAEIRKLPRAVCQRCRLEFVATAVRDGRCVNVIACDRRLVRQARRRAEAPGE
jgi:hypothetical protein